MCGWLSSSGWPGGSHGQAADGWGVSVEAAGTLPATAALHKTTGEDGGPLGTTSMYYRRLHCTGLQ